MILEAKPDKPGSLELTNGQARRITVHHAPKLFVTLLPEDAARFKVLAAGVPGRRVLIMFGETPIGLTGVSDLLENLTFTVAHNSADEASLRKLADDLNRLIVPTLKGLDKRLNDRKTWLDADLYDF